MLELLVDFFWRVGHWSYLLLFVAAMLESAAFLGLFVPGEMLTILAGVLVSAGLLELPQSMAVAAAGAAIGDSIGYELGRSLGRPWLLAHGARVGVRQTALQRLDELFARHGGKTVLIARFVGILRALAPFIAGASRMPYRWFLLFNVMGAVLWAVAFVSLGYALGASWWVAEKWIGRIGMIVGVVIVVTAIIWLRRYRHRRDG
jgi:membrane protein DedA with SNARE-associated domain